MGQNLRLREIPSLNGIRGIAALAVVLTHVISPSLPGVYAVIVFFVLSGFLITWILSGELERTGKIEIYGFYLRRVRRLFPAYYVWLAAVVVLLTRSFTPELKAAAFYLSDYYNAWVREGMFAHTWSLSVEEHFYLIWPALLMWLSGRKNKFAPIWMVIGATELARLVFAGRHPIWFFYSFEARVDGLLIGCMLALWLRGEPGIPAWALQRSASIATCGVMAVCMVLQWTWQRRLGDTIIAWTAAVLICQLAAKPPLILNNPVARYLGAISYSLYLYHVLVRWVYMRLVPGASDGTFVVHGWNNRIAVIALSLAAAGVSYAFVERPIQQWRRGNVPQLAATTSSVRG